jgi:hypothetical protein
MKDVRQAVEEIVGRVPLSANQIIEIAHVVWPKPKKMAETTVRRACNELAERGIFEEVTQRPQTWRRITEFTGKGVMP